MADTTTKAVRFLETSAGRDKLSRALQYACKFRAWSLADADPALAKRLANVEASSSLARKLFRLGKPLQLIQVASRTLNEIMEQKGEPDPVRVTTLVQNVAMIFWLSYDHCIWAQKAQLVDKFDLKKLGRRANWFWLVAMMCGVLKAAYLLQVAQRAVDAKKLKKADDSGADLAALEKRRTDVLLELVRNVFDLPIPLSGLFPGFAETVPSGMVGLSGLFTSFIGIYQQWEKM